MIYLSAAAFLISTLLLCYSFYQFHSALAKSRQNGFLSGYKEASEKYYDEGFLASWKDAQETYIADDEEDRTIQFNNGVEACIEKVISLYPISDLPGEGRAFKKLLEEHFSIDDEEDEEETKE